MNLLLRQSREAPLLQLAGDALDKLLGLLGKARPLPTLPDCTLGLFRDPYRFVLRTCARLGSDVFQGRIMLRKTVFMMGQDAAELFYNRELFTREGAAPLRIQNTLFGRGGVQTLDGDRHRQRKAMFMSVLANPQLVRQLSQLAGDALRRQALSWPGQPSIDFYRETREALTRAVCAWAGLPLPEEDVGQRTEQLTALFDQASLFGPPHWRSWLMRKRAERWCGRIVEDVRNERLFPPEESALFAVSWHRDSDGGLLDRHAAAVELLNFLRPVVAVSVYAVFAAIALEEHPGYRERLRREDEPLLQAFVQEVRRCYPFFPMVAARARRGFDWKGFHFPAGVRVMLDLFATNHDPRLWDTPGEFFPERFFRREPGAFGLIPQGGGDAHTHHRCPGENVALEIMKTVTRFLCREIGYEVAPQDLRLDWRRLPALPHGYFLLRNVVAPDSVALLPASDAQASAIAPGLSH